MVLESIVKPLNDTLFKGQCWIFQQHSTPVHKSKHCQEWLANNISACIQAEDWTSGSPDINPFDYELWGILEQKVCLKCHPNLELFRRSIIEEAVKIPLETICKSIAK